MLYRPADTWPSGSPQIVRFAEVLRGICVDAADRVYAVGASEVRVYDAGGVLLRRWTTAHPGYGVAVARDGVVHVGQDGQVERYDEAGRLRGTFRDGDRLGRVTAIGWTDECLLVADATHRCIRCYDHTGKWRNDIGADTRTKGFLMPNGWLDFVVDGDGILHVAHPAKFRVERYAAGGKLLGSFGRFGTRALEDFTGCCNPTNLARARDGRILVTEKAPARAKVFDAGGRMVALIPPEAFDQNSKNMDIAVDSRGRVFIADTARKQILAFVPAESPVSAPATAASREASYP